MPRTPKRLAGPTVLSAAAATKYTVPAGTKTVVRHIHVENGTALAATFTLSIGADASGTRLFDAVSIPGNTPYEAFCYYVLEATEIIQAFGGTASALVLTIDGDEYTLG